MNRDQIQTNSELITLKFVTMETEMCRTVAQPIVPDTEACLFNYFRITEIPKKDMPAAESEKVSSILEKCIVGLYTLNIPFSIAVCGRDGRVFYYIGTYEAFFDSMCSLLTATVPNIRIETKTNGNSRKYDWPFFARLYEKNRYGGFIKGNPGYSRVEHNIDGIDLVIKGMNQNSWLVQIYAYPIGKDETLQRQQHWLTEATKCSELTSVTYTDTDNIESVSYRTKYYHSEQYLKKVEAFSAELIESTALGEWCVSFNFASDSVDNSKLLGGLLVSAFYKDDYLAEPIHAIYRNQSGIICTESIARLSIPGFQVTSAAGNSRFLSIRRILIQAVFRSLTRYRSM